MLHIKTGQFIAISFLTQWTGSFYKYLSLVCKFI